VCVCVCVVLASDRQSCPINSQSSASRGQRAPVNVLPSTPMSRVHSPGGTTSPWWSGDFVSTTLMSGFLAGVWAADTGCGTSDAPWVVKVGLGQRINVTVFDFSVQRTLLNDTEPLPAGARSRQLDNLTIATLRPPSEFVIKTIKIFISMIGQNMNFAYDNLTPEMLS